LITDDRTTECSKEENINYFKKEESKKNVLVKVPSKKFSGFKLNKGVNKNMSMSKMKQR
jgi:hypothetical protein